MVIPGVNTATGTPDPHLCRLDAQARRWFEQLSSGEVSSVRAIAKGEKVHETEVSRVLPLAFLAPIIVELILDGGHTVGLTASTLKRLNPFQSSWDAQHKSLGLKYQAANQHTDWTPKSGNRDFYQIRPSLPLHTNFSH